MNCGAAWPNNRYGELPEPGKGAGNENSKQQQPHFYRAAAKEKTQINPIKMLKTGQSS